jgi:hypothetical protein
MGVFDNESNRKFNDAKPNYAEDGIDIVDCDKECVYRDVSKNRCTFETCVLKHYPYTIEYHSHTTVKCMICEENIEIDLSDFSVPHIALLAPICDKCRQRIRGLIND